MLMLSFWIFMFWTFILQMPMSASEIGSNFQSDGFAKAGGSGGPGAVGGQFNVKEATQVSIDKSLSFGIRCTCSLFTFLQLFVYLYLDIIIYFILCFRLFQIQALVPWSSKVLEDRSKILKTILVAASTLCNSIKKLLKGPKPHLRR